jgi:hypothetical protein
LLTIPASIFFIFRSYYIIEHKGAAPVTNAAANKEATAINSEMVATMVVIHRISSRALSAEERVGQSIQRDPRGEIDGLLVQMAAIGQLVRLALPKEGRELLEVAAAKDQAAASRAAGRKEH